jgi:hypothetical protein
MMERLVRLESQRLSNPKDLKNLSELARAYAGLGLVRVAGDLWLEYAQGRLEAGDEAGVWEGLEGFMELVPPGSRLRDYFNELKGSG